MKLILIERKVEVPGVESFIFQPEEKIEWKPGQYLHYTLPHDPADDRGVERWFTIAAAPFEGHIMITTRLSGEQGSSFKRALAALSIGETIEADGVEGDFTIEDETLQYVFIAGGIGITPFHSILKQADHDGKKLSVTLLYANRDKNVPYKQELETFAQNNAQLQIHDITAPKQIDASVIQEYVPERTGRVFYISGPEPMVKSLAEVVKDMGVPEEKIKIDDFPGYTA